MSPPSSSSVSIRCLARIAGLPRLLKHGWAAATWRSPRHHTLLFLFVGWPALCYGFHLVLPLLVLYASYRKQASSTDDDADERLKRALETLDLIDRLERAWDTQCTWPTVLGVASAWIALVAVFAPWQVLWVGGTVLSLLCNPYMPTAFLGSLWLALVSGQQDQGDSIGVSLTQHVEDFQRKHMQANTPFCEFEFVLYENQRSWPLSGWKSQTFPVIDRATWTDGASKPIKPKTQFELPETIHAGTRTWTWRWTDPEWVLASGGDELGWMYGTPFWSVFGPEPKGWISTRRRRWARKAVLSCMPPPPTPHQAAPVSAPARTQRPPLPPSIVTSPSPSPSAPPPPVSPTPSSKKSARNLSTLTLDSITSSTTLKKTPSSSAARRESGTSWKSIVRVKH